MSNQKKGFTDEELKMMAEMESLIAEMNQHPEVMNEPLPENLHKELWRDIREYKEEQAEAVSPKPEPEVARLTDEEKELIQLGKIYKRKKKNKKFYVLIAAVIGAMTFGITSMGGPEKVFERFGFGISNRDQEHINSNNDVILDTKAAEEEVYQEIEDEYGFTPVRMMYLPEGIEFIKSVQQDEMQAIRLYYGENEKVNISYFIRPNYREGSWGINIEDSLQETYVKRIEGNELIIKKFQVEETRENRWSVEYSYGNGQYFLLIMNLSEQEFQEIIKNLYFC